MACPKPTPLRLEYLPKDLLKGLKRHYRSFPGGSDSQESAFNAVTPGLISLGHEDVLEKGTATHSSNLAWRISWTEEPGYSPWGHMELDTTERPALAFYD